MLHYAGILQGLHSATLCRHTVDCPDNVGTTQEAIINIFSTDVLIKCIQRFSSFNTFQLSEASAKARM